MRGWILSYSSQSPGLALSSIIFSVSHHIIITLIMTFLFLPCSDERRVRADLQQIGLQNQEEKAKKRAQALEGMEEMKQKQEEQISEVRVMLLSICLILTI